MIKVYADGADKQSILELNKLDYVSGFTTNPTLMAKAGITDYVGFAKGILEEITEKPISFEVFSDDIDEMERQAREINSWGKNVYVKIPVMNTKGSPTYTLQRKLSNDGIKLNVTAILTTSQAELVTDALDENTPSIVSIFAGRVADTGVDPIPQMVKALEYLKSKPLGELLWASPREVLNVYQADSIGCHIITVTPEIMKKLDLKGKDLDKISRETVQMFYDDANSAGFSL